MELTSDFAFKPLPPLANATHFPFPVILNPLGPLADLPGTWTGSGFNQIWRPFHAPNPPIPNQPPPPAGQDRFLELNLTQETLTFETISGPIPNRGLLQADMNMFGLTYLQQISDRNVKDAQGHGAGLHIEPGIWVSVPPTANPVEGPTVCRMASIPHGTTILAQGTSFAVNGPPVFTAADITPFRIGQPTQKIKFPESNLAVPTAFRSPPPQIAGITQGMVDNPNSVLQAAIAGQTITHTIVLVVSSDPVAPVIGGGTANTAFLQGAAGGPNAQATHVTSTFWLEVVKGQAGQADFHQLQYTQTVLLNFNGLSWPHVTVGTLKRNVPVHVPIRQLDPDIPAELLKEIPVPVTVPVPVGPGPLRQQ